MIIREREAHPSLIRANNPFGITRGPDGLIYVCEFLGHCVRRIEKDGTFSLIAGQPGMAGYTGDGGPATEAQLNRPHEVRFDRKGRLYISDNSNHAVRRIEDGVITTVAGTGQAGFSGDGGPATKATFKLPISIQLDRKGVIFIGDSENHRVRRITPGK